MNTELIEKESIEVDQIIPAETMLSEELLTKLASTSRLGNEFKGKVTITFNTKNGAKRVSTTVWAVTENFIQLKNNIHIPIKSIIDLDF